jgi:hypothetical protein
MAGQADRAFNRALVSAWRSSMADVPIKARPHWEGMEQQAARSRQEGGSKLLPCLLPTKQPSVRSAKPSNPRNRGHGLRGAS